MNWKNALIIALAGVLAVTIGYILYFYSGPYKRLHSENQRLMEKSVARQAWESKTEEEVAELRRTLEKQRRETHVAREEIIKKEHLVKDLRNKIQGLRGMIFKVQGEKETLMAEVSQLRKAFGKSQSHRNELSRQIEKLKGDYQRHMQGLQDQVVEGDRQIQSLQGERDRFRQAIAKLENDGKSLSEQVSELKSGLKQSKGRLQTLSQDLMDRERKLERASQNYQEMVQQLREQIQQREVRISTLEERTSIHFLSKILFEPGNANITPHGRQVLKTVAEGLKKLSDTKIHVEGHTDNQPLSEAARGVYIDNLGLSVKRATAVARVFRMMGVDPRNLSAAGFSMYRPVASNDTPDGRQQNRRVEIVLAPVR
ncbi:MAG: OmpA family protein [Deltaproteobacteria bacterium]|nr:MAG: OmpA family protein [Deltaproteobacteria bacterium]